MLAMMAGSATISLRIDRPECAGQATIGEEEYPCGATNTGVRLDDRRRAGRKRCVAGYCSENGAARILLFLIADRAVANACF